MDVILLEEEQGKSSSLPEYTNTRFFASNSEMLSERRSILSAYENARSSVLASISSCNARGREHVRVQPSNESTNKVPLVSVPY